MRVATWNVNGIRARFGDVVAWAERCRPDVFCLQEIKAAPSQVPEPLTGLPEYYSYWHGAEGGYSGVSLHVRRELSRAQPRFGRPAFDVQTRIADVTLDAVTLDGGTAGGVVIASVYVPNGSKDYQLKLSFLRSLRDYVAELHEAGRQVIIAGDLNVTRTAADVHPEQRKKGAIGQRRDERALLEEILATGLADVTRELMPDDDRIFTWWPPWREQKQKNRGWRIDYVLVSRELWPQVTGCEILEDEGSSDHVPLMVELH